MTYLQVLYASKFKAALAPLSLYYLENVLLGVRCGSHLNPAVINAVVKLGSLYEKHHIAGASHKILCGQDIFLDDDKIRIGGDG